MSPHATSPRPLIESKILRFLPRLHQWYRLHRRPLPWRSNPTAYRTAVAEFMCQQTRITTVIPYFERWMRRFPGWTALAQAPFSRVLRMWEGLGYYRRARSLHSLAKIVARHPRRQLPKTPAALRKMPGIGDYTAGAIASIAFGCAAPAFDGNVARVLGRLTAHKKTARPGPWLRNLAARIVPRRNPGLHNQALMELGAMICLPLYPRCSICPLAPICPSRQHLPKTGKQKPAILQEEEVILLARKRDRVWLTRTHPKNRWQGLYLLPTQTGRTNKAPILKISYPFTRHKIRSSVVAVRQPPPEIPGAWMRREELTHAAMPAPHRKILRSLGIG